MANLTFHTLQSLNRRTVEDVPFSGPVRKGMPLPETFSHHTDRAGPADLKDVVLCVGNVPGLRPMTGL